MSYHHKLETFLKTNDVSRARQQLLDDLTPFYVSRRHNEKLLGKKKLGKSFKLLTNNQ